MELAKVELFYCKFRAQLAFKAVFNADTISFVYLINSSILDYRDIHDKALIAPPSCARRGYRGLGVTGC